MIEKKLKQDAELLKKQLTWLKLSCSECKNISIKENYTIDEFGKFLEFVIIANPRLSWVLGPELRTKPILCFN